MRFLSVAVLALLPTAALAQSPAPATPATPSAAAVASAAAGTAIADVAVMPADVKFAKLPFGQGLEAAWMVGAPGDKPGLYTLRVKLAKDGKIPPHTHPDNRMVTVISGELYSGRGTEFKESEVKMYPAGSFFTMPAGQPHYVWAKSGEVIYQEAGSGPTANNFLQKTN